jgi:DNA-binding response OmpR family regulator
MKVSIDRRSGESDYQVGNKKRIIVVDDNRQIAESPKEILESADYCVETAETGQEALERFSARPFDVALLDVKLPDMEGTHLLKMLKNIEKASSKSRMVKIMITGFADQRNAMDSLNSGADAFLMKPVAVKEVLAVIEEKLALRKVDP